MDVDLVDGQLAVAVGAGRGFGRRLGEEGRGDGEVGCRGCRYTVDRFQGFSHFRHFDGGCFSEYEEVQVAMRVFFRRGRGHFCPRIQAKEPGKEEGRECGMLGGGEPEWDETRTGRES